MASNKLSISQFKALVASPEKDEVKLCLDVLSVTSIVAYRMNTGAVRYNDECPHCLKRPNALYSTRYTQFGVKGMPDICGYIPAREPGGRAIPFFWEVKRRGGRIRKEQSQFVENAMDAGCFSGIGTSADLIKALKDQQLI